MATVVTMSLPFQVSEGKIADTSDYKKIWDDRVRSVILTSKYERVHRPAFGADIRSSLLENSFGPGSAEEKVAASVRAAFAEHLRPLTVKSVTSSFNFQESIMNISISYQLPNNQEAWSAIYSLSVAGDAPPAVTSPSPSDSTTGAK